MDSMTIKNDKGRKMEMPDMNMDSVKMPVMKDMEVGKTYTVKMKMKMLSKSETHPSASWSGDGKLSGGFKMMGAEMMDSKEPADMGREEHGKYMAGERAKAAKA